MCFVLFCFHTRSGLAGPERGKEKENLHQLELLRLECTPIDILYPRVCLVGIITQRPSGYFTYPIGGNLGKTFHTLPKTSVTLEYPCMVGTLPFTLPKILVTLVRYSIPYPKFWSFWQYFYPGTSNDSLPNPLFPSP